VALWQFRIVLIPEAALVKIFGIVPTAIPMELAENFAWWSDFQPPTGFERQINTILPQMESWSDTMLMWGQEHGNDAYVCYIDKSKSTVEEIGFRLDARNVSAALVSATCSLAKQLGCVFLTTEYAILQPENSDVLRAIQYSTAKKFVDDPASALQNLDQTKLQKRLDYLVKDDDLSQKN
jgi:hypothetical protein